MLFPDAHLGWGRNEDGGFLVQSTSGVRLTQIGYYTNLLMRDFIWNPALNAYTPLRFGRFGPLYNEYLVDMYSRVEDERLDTIRSDSIQQRMAKRVDIERNVDNLDSLQRLGRSVLGSSFVNSTRHNKKELANAYALCDHFGRASLFITITCNPHWEEITNLLKPGQQAGEHNSQATCIAANLAAI
jgi:hypothetical protein